MNGETYVTVIGNLVADPELRHTGAGAAVVNFTVASTPRRYDKLAKMWRDREVLFMRCNVWREQAVNVADSLRKGDRVMVFGELVMRSFKFGDEQRTIMEMEVEEVGASLRRCAVQVEEREEKN